MLLVGVAQILFGTLYNIKDPKVFRKVENWPNLDKYLNNREQHSPNYLGTQPRLIFEPVRNMCILTRILEGVGNAGATLASTSILSQVIGWQLLKVCLPMVLMNWMIIQLKSFPDNLGLVISTMEVFAGLGGILGPFVGGTLFDLGGYVAPFYGCGGFQLFTLLGMEWNAWSRCDIYVVPVFWAFLATLDFHD